MKKINKKIFLHFQNDKKYSLKKKIIIRKFNKFYIYI